MEPDMQIDTQPLQINADTQNVQDGGGWNVVGNFQFRSPKMFNSWAVTNKLDIHESN